MAYKSFHLPNAFVQLAAGAEEFILNLDAVEKVERVGNQARITYRNGVIEDLPTTPHSVNLKAFLQEASDGEYDDGT